MPFQSPSCSASRARRRHARLALALLSPLTLAGSLLVATSAQAGHAPGSAASRSAASGSVGSGSAGSLSLAFDAVASDTGLSVTWDEFAQPHEVTQVVVEVTDGSTVVDRSVVPVEVGKVLVDHLGYEHDYGVRLRTLADGVPLASSTASVRTGPVLDSFAVEAIAPVAGARLPFTAALTRPASRDVTVVVSPEEGPFDLTPFEVTVPAGRRTVEGSIPLITKGIGPDDAPYVSIDAAIKGAPASSFNGDFRYLPPVSSHPVTATMTVPETVPEPPAGEQGSIPVTVTLDGPSPGVTYDFEAVRADRAGHPDYGDPTLRADLTVPEGERSVTVDVPITGDAVPDGDVTWLIHYSYPRFVSGSLPHTTTAQVTVLDDDAPAPDLVLSAPSYSWEVPMLGRVSAGAVHWVNRGSRTAKDVRLTGSISGGTPQLRIVTGRGACTVTRSGSAVRYSCPIGDVPPGFSGGAEVEDAATTPAAEVVDEAHLEVAGDPTPDDLTVSTSGDVTGAACTIVGKIGADTLTGTSDDDVICGPARGRGAPDVVVPGAGNDTLLVSGLIDESGAPKGLKVLDNHEGVSITGWGTDYYPIGQWYVRDQAGTTVRGTPKNDVIRLTGMVGVEAGAGNDRVSIGSNAFWAPIITLDGGPGVDTLTVYPWRMPVTIRLGTAITGFEKVVADTGRQTVIGSPAAESIRTGEDDDVVDVADGVGGNDTVDAGSGDDTCTADVGDTVTNCEHVTWVPVPAS